MLEKFTHQKFVARTEADLKDKEIDVKFAAEELMFAATALKEAKKVYARQKEIFERDTGTEYPNPPDPRWP